MVSSSIGLFVTARAKSSRLERKMFCDIEGRPALWYVLDRMKTPRSPSSRVVCTTTEPRDDEIEHLARTSGWSAFRGHEDDVLERYLGAADRFDVEFFVNVDGDDLFCGAEYVDRIVQRYRETGADYVWCSGLPLGGAPTGVRVHALREVCARKGEIDTQGWGKYFLKSGIFHTECVLADASVSRPDYRMTLDYPEDLEFFRTVVRMLRTGGARDLDLCAVVSLLDAHPEVVRLSQQVNERYWERFNREHGGFSLK